MKKYTQWIIQEFFHVLPGLIFFFIAFNLINYTESLMFRAEDVKAFSFFAVLLGAGVVAKILLVFDHLPVITLFRKKPLIYNILWQTMIYSLVALLIRYLTNLYPFTQFQERTVYYESFRAAVDWTRFWAIQIWYIVLFFVFTLTRELIRVIGKEKIARILFGKTF